MLIRPQIGGILLNHSQLGLPLGLALAQEIHQEGN